MDENRVDFMDNSNFYNSYGIFYKFKNNKMTILQKIKRFFTWDPRDTPSNIDWKFY